MSSRPTSAAPAAAGSIIGRSDFRRRNDYPYGKWTCADGREVLHNRFYEPIWQRRPGSDPEPADAAEWVADIVKDEWLTKTATASGKLAAPPQHCASGASPTRIHRADPRDDRRRANGTFCRRRVCPRGKQRFPRCRRNLRRQSAEAAINAGLPPEYSVAMRVQFSRAYWVARDVMRSDKSAVQKFVEIGVGRNRYGIDLVVAAAVETAAQRPAIALGDCHEQGVSPVACQAGCSSCRHQHVDVSASEACLIALYLRAQKRKPDLDRAAAMVSDLSHTKRWARGIACPFLLDRKCSVYVRPEPARRN